MASKGPQSTGCDREGGSGERGEQEEAQAPPPACAQQDGTASATRAVESVSAPGRMLPSATPLLQAPRPGTGVPGPSPERCFRPSYRPAAGSRARSRRPHSPPARRSTASGPGAEARRAGGGRCGLGAGTQRPGRTRLFPLPAHSPRVESPGSREEIERSGSTALGSQSSGRAKQSQVAQPEPGAGSRDLPRPPLSGSVRPGSAALGGRARDHSGS